MGIEPDLADGLKVIAVPGIFAIVPSYKFRQLRFQSSRLGGILKLNIGVVWIEAAEPCQILLLINIGRQKVEMKM